MTERFIKLCASAQHAPHVHARDGSTVRVDVAVSCMDKQILDRLESYDLTPQTLFDMYATYHRRIHKKEWELYRTIPASLASAIKKF